MAYHHPWAQAWQLNKFHPLPILLGQGQERKMRDEGERRKGLTLTNDSLAVTPVQIGPLDDMVLSIHPVHTAPSIVNGETIGPEEMGICDDTTSRAIHARGLNAGGITPVCPINGSRKKEKEIERQAEESGWVVTRIITRKGLLFI
jgi:hypothetical protein